MEELTKCHPLRPSRLDAVHRLENLGPAESRGGEPISGSNPLTCSVPSSPPIYIELRLITQFICPLLIPSGGRSVRLTVPITNWSSLQPGHIGSVLEAGGVENLTIWVLVNVKFEA